MESSMEIRAVNNIVRRRVFVLEIRNQLRVPNGISIFPSAERDAVWTDNAVFQERSHAEFVQYAR